MTSILRVEFCIATQEKSLKYEQYIKNATDFTKPVNNLKIKPCVCIQSQSNQVQNLFRNQILL